MSKASEWAATLDDPHPMLAMADGLQFWAPGAMLGVTAWPVGEARLTVYHTNSGYSHPTMTANEAIAAARWILATFDEDAAPLAKRSGARP